MSLPAPYSEVYEAGTGAQVEFPFGNNFKPISAGLVKCKVYFPDGYETVPTYTVDMVAGSITISALTLSDGTILTAPPVGSTVRIYRDEPEAQNVTASQLQAYTAKQLEIALDAIVAMIQEVSYTLDHKTVRLTEPQRDIALQQLSELEDGHLIYWDNTERKLVVTNYPQQDVVRCVNGLFFRLRTDPDTHNEFLQWSVDNSNWNSINVDAAQALAQSAYDLADSAYNLAFNTRGELNAHKADHNNPHETTLANLIDTDFDNVIAGQFIMFDGLHWKNVYSSTSVGWGAILGNIDDQADLMNALNNRVHIDGSSIMTGPLKMRATSSFQCAIAPFWDGVGFYKLNSDDSVTLIASIEDPDGFVPWVTNTYNIGSSLKKWKNLYLGGKLFVSTINNGGDLTFPANTTGTLATKADVDLAANSGRMITDQGVWYAKMYAATVAPAAEDGTNYADFSQVDGQGNPIIVTYNRVSGAWVQDQTITPPAEYDGYVPITSKIWDIVEQAGQQGGRILWNHQSKEFTPYPQIISFENIEVTGNSTVIMPQNPGTNQIVNKDYVDEAIAAIPTPTVDIKQSIDAEIVGTLTVADNGDVSGSWNYNTNYLHHPCDLVFTGANTFEIVIAFTTSNTYSSSRSFSFNNSQTTYLGMDFGASATSVESFNHIKLRVGSGTSNTYQTITGTSNLETNTKYYAKLVYDGTDYILSVSTDGVNYTVDTTVAAQYVPSAGDLPTKLYGSDSNGTIYLSECYIKKNGILVWQGMDAPGLHQRVVKGHEVIAFQAPTSGNNYTWYRKYADGWVEQGGHTTSQNVTFPITMADTNYHVLLTGTATQSNNNVRIVGFRNATTTSMVLQCNVVNQSSQTSVANDGIKYWEVKGMAQ